MKSKRLLITAAAIAGLYAGALTARAAIDESKAGTPAKDEKKEKASCGGKEGCGAKDKDKSSCKAKESCKAKDSCKAKESCGAKDDKKSTSA